MSEGATLVDRCDRCGSMLRPMQPEQHRAVEAVYQDIALQLDWPLGSGIKRDPWTWHQLMLAAFAEDKGWQPQILPALTGNGFVMTTRTKQSRLTVKQGAELKHFARAWALEQGVALRDPVAR
jgi:hypothetical protein